MIETRRLRLRQLTVSDAGFIRNLLNQPSWLRFIGDKNVHTFADARRYIEHGPMASYQRSGFGLYRVGLRGEGNRANRSIGICGLIQRDTLDDVDIGFAFLPECCGAGYAFEAAAATLNYAKDVAGLNRVVAITAPDNLRSIQLLQKLGMTFERSTALSEGAAPVQLFGIDFHASRPSAPP